MKTFRAYVGKSFDKKTGIAKGVSVISVGPALGHGTNVDKKSLESVVAASKASPDGVKVHIQHDSDAKDIVGFLNNFQLDGDNVRADLKLVRMSPWFGYLCELIETNPSSFGLSISFDGTEEMVNEASFIRVKDLFSVDLVSSPAANSSGLFSSKVIKGKKLMADESQTAEKVALSDADDELASRVGLLEKGFADMKSAFDAMADNSDNGDDSSNGDDDDEEQAEDDESDSSDDLAKVKAELAAVKAENEKLKAEKVSGEKLAARKLATTGVKAGARPKTEAASPSIVQQYKALKSCSEQLNFYRKHKAELLEHREELAEKK
jgi:hypothetical protein